METFVINTSPGLEPLLREECERIDPSIEFEELKAALRFKTTLEKALKLSICSRIASRLFQEISVFECTNQEEFEIGLDEIEWDLLVTLNSTFRFSAHGLIEGKGLKRSHAPLVAKDILCDYFREKYQKRPSVKTKNSQVHFELYFESQDLRLLVELSKQPLHKRGYRSDGGEAPLRENLAYTLQHFAEIKEDCVIDPFCGSGTLLIETALANSEPDYRRASLIFSADRPSTEYWKSIGDTVRELYKNRPEHKNDQKLPKLIGFDNTNAQLRQAEENAKQAGVSEHIEFHKKDVLSHEPGTFKNCLVLCNPPHGDRLLEDNEAKELLRSFVKTLKFEHSPCRLALVLPDNGLAKSVGLSPTKKLRVGAGAKSYVFLVYDLYSGSKKTKP